MPAKKRDNLQAQLTQLNTEIIPAIATSRQQIHDKAKRVGILVSVARGVYDESDKLCKKAPAETVTELALSHINHVIHETKAVANDDPFIARLNEFVPAGENPEQRDVVLVLRQIIQGLERTANATTAELDVLDKRLEMARGLSQAIALKVEDEVDEVTQEILNRYGARVPAKFLECDAMGDPVFDFDLLGRTDLAVLFATKQ